jgi:hypothetical protein
MFVPTNGRSNAAYPAPTGIPATKWPPPRAVGPSGRTSSLEVAAKFLFAFYGFEEGFEVALAEAAAALALDDLVEDGGAVFYRLGEDLQHVALVVAVDEDAQLFQFVDGFVDFADAGLQLGVIGVRDGEEVHALLLHLRDGAENVFGSEGHVLDAGPLVEVEVLLDLGFAAAFGGLVDGEFDVAVAVGHHLGHERGVLGGDVVVVEVLIEAEAHDVAVEVDPLVHGVPADVADDVVDVEKADGTGDGVVLDGVVAGEEGAGVVGAVDEGVDGVAVGGDAGGGDAAVGIREFGGFLDAAGSAAGGFEPGLASVVDPESDGADTVAVGVDVASDVAVGTEGGGEDEADLSLLEDVAGAVTLAGLGACVGDQGHAKGGSVEVGGLAGVAYVELDVVGAFEGEEVWGDGGLRLRDGVGLCCHGYLRGLDGDGTRSDEDMLCDGVLASCPAGRAHCAQSPRFGGHFVACIPFCGSTSCLALAMLGSSLKIVLGGWWRGIRRDLCGDGLGAGRSREE